MKSACIHEVFKGFSDTLNKSHYQNNSDAEIPTVTVEPRSFENDIAPYFEKAVEFLLRPCRRLRAAPP